MSQISMRTLVSDYEPEALELFVSLLRIDTTNPPGRERPAAELCAEWLRRDGLEPVLLEAQKDRTNLVCRLRGTGELPPLLLTAHLDVVPAGEGWQIAPFAGEIHDGYLWGRGAVDMKHHVAMSVTVMRALAREGVPLRRDLILALTADEESGCDLGSTWLVDNHGEKVKAEYALGEIGGFTMHLAGRRFYPIQVAQKGVMWMKARARGPGGHGSMPREGTAVSRLSRALWRLSDSTLPTHVPDVTRAFVTNVLAAVGLSGRFPAEALLHPRLARTVLGVLPDRNLARSLLPLFSNTVTPTIVRAGDKINQIPAVAEAELDGRTLPGRVGDLLLEELKTLVGQDIEIEVVRELPAIEASFETPLFSTLAEAIRRGDPEGIAVPFLIPGFTDGYAFSRNGAIYYGFAPVGLPPGLDFAGLYHNVDERIPVEGFHWGLHVLHDAVHTFCSASDG